MKLFSLPNFPLDNRTILVRVDFNVPLKNGQVMDNSKIIASLPTIKLLLQKNCRVILATHLGQPSGKIVPELRTDVLAEELQNLLHSVKIIKLDDCIGQSVKEAILNAKTNRKKQIFLLENLRFYREEEDNDPVFAHALASLADIYVNDAFAACHRNHASVDKITHFLPSIPGLLLEKEINFLSQALHPQKPAVWIMGGAKLDKIDLLQQAFKKADTILIGGALAFAFLKAKKINVGMSKSDADSVKTAHHILKSSVAKKIILPIDFMVTETMSPRGKSRVARYDQIKINEIALDLGLETIELFEHHLKDSQTIVWNGPLGYFEWAKFATATREIARFLGTLKAVSICGGGETGEAVRKFHLEHHFTHVSTGGGTALAFLAGEKLPALRALEENYKKFRKRVGVL